MAEPQSLNIRLPLDLIDDHRGAEISGGGAKVTIAVPDSYADDMTTEIARSEVIGIQRLLTLCRHGDPHVHWGQGIANRALRSPNIFPLLAVLVALENATHTIDGLDEQQAEDAMDTARRTLFNARLKADLFSDTQVVICADSRGRGAPPDLYGRDGRLIQREDFEATVEEVVTRQAATELSTSPAVQWSSALATVVSELFENSDTHGKTELSGLPIRKNGIRGLVLKRTKIDRPKLKNNEGNVDKPIEAFELSVFDSGPGFYGSFMREPITPDVHIEREWKVVHSCLERHYEADLTDVRRGHRGLGLYEVLRALLLLRGAIEVRTGRVYGYRTFMEGAIKFAMEPSTSSTRPGMPKPQLLDVERRFVSAPTEHELLLGTSIRIVVPLH